MRQLQENEKNSYLQTMVFISSSDGIISKEEISALKGMASNIGVSEEKVDQLISEVKNGKELKEILDGIQNRQAKLLLIYELITLCYADGVYSNNEKESMKNICNLLKVEHAKLFEIEDIITEYIEFQKKVNKVLEVEACE